VFVYLFLDLSIFKKDIDLLNNENKNYELSSNIQHVLSKYIFFVIYVPQRNLMLPKIQICYCKSCYSLFITQQRAGNCLCIILNI
jgi:hypothetical protein